MKELLIWAGRPLRESHSVLAFPNSQKKAPSIHKNTRLPKSKGRQRKPLVHDKSTACAEKNLTSLLPLSATWEHFSFKGN